MIALVQDKAHRMLLKCVLKCSECKYTQLSRPLSVGSSALRRVFCSGSVSERVLQQHPAAPRGRAQPHHRRRRQQVPGGREWPAEADRVQLCRRQAHEAPLAFHSGNNPRERHYTKNKAAGKVELSERRRANLEACGGKPRTTKT